MGERRGYVVFYFVLFCFSLIRTVTTTRETSYLLLRLVFRVIIFGVELFSEFNRIFLMKHYIPTVRGLFGCVCKRELFIDMKFVYNKNINLVIFVAFTLLRSFLCLCAHGMQKLYKEEEQQQYVDI